MAKLRFLSDWAHEQDGDIRCGEELVIEYDVARLPTTRSKRKARVSANIVFHPSRQALTTSVDPEPAEVTIPPGVTTIELWFDRTDSSGAVVYDSHFGHNYWLPVRAGEEIQTSAPVLASAPFPTDEPVRANTEPARAARVSSARTTRTKAGK